MLIVEDDPLILMTAAAALRDAGFAVLEVETVDAAAGLLGAMGGQVDAIFTDIETPGRLDGLELARVAAAVWPDVLVVVTSGRITPTASALPRNGRFLPKPYDPTQVATMLFALTAHRDASGAISPEG